MPLSVFLRFLWISTAVLFIIVSHTELLLTQVTIENRERNIRTSIAAWLQPRYDFFNPSGADPISRFSIRRAQLDIRGYVFSEKLTYRITPELSDLDLEYARNVYPIHLYMNYELSPRAQITFGQFAVPFHWHFYVPLSGLYFYERSLASSDFGTFGGWDKGVMFHGITSLAGQPFSYAFAVVDGEGFNRKKTRNTGHTFSMQAVYAPLGTFPAGESDFGRSETPELTIGAGVQYGMKSESREWTLGRSPDNRADFSTGTLFSRFAFMGFSLIGEVYYRRVMPEAAAVHDFNAHAFTIAGGFMFIKKRLEIVGRYSELNYDIHLPGADASELGFGFNLFFKGHNTQLRLQYQKVEGGIHAPVNGYDQLVLEIQIQFF